MEHALTTREEVLDILFSLPPLQGLGEQRLDRRTDIFFSDAYETTKYRVVLFNVTGSPNLLYGSIVKEGPSGYTVRTNRGTYYWTPHRVFKNKPALWGTEVV
jgi:hypothetical protein